MTTKIQSSIKPSRAPYIYEYDVFYELSEEEGFNCTGRVTGVNWAEAKENFEKIFGTYKITNHQRLGKIN